MFTLDRVITSQFLKKIWGKDFPFMIQELFHQHPAKIIIAKTPIPISFAQQISLFFATLKYLRATPFEYIFKHKEFLEIDFKVNRHTLIPRPETEELVNLFIKDHHQDKPLKILDIGTGCGAIAITIKKKFPKSQVIAVDCSSKALALAKENSLKILEPQNQITLLLGNIFSQELEKKINYHNTKGQFDCIISNPPYIALSEKKDLAKAVVKYEPSQALFAGEDGLDFYRQLVPKVKSWLKKDGCIYLECGYNQGEAVKEYFNFLYGKLMNDSYGKIRFYKGNRINH